MTVQRKLSVRKVSPIYLKRDLKEISDSANLISASRPSLSLRALTLKQKTSTLGSRSEIHQGEGGFEKLLK